MADNSEVPGEASQKPITNPPELSAGSEATEIPQQETNIPDSITKGDITKTETPATTTPQPAAMEYIIMPIAMKESAVGNPISGNF